MSGRFRKMDKDWLKKVDAIDAKIMFDSLENQKQKHHLIKKIIRKLIQWYIVPMLKKQEALNQEMKEVLLMQYHQIHELQEKLGEYERQRADIQALASKIQVLEDKILGCQEITSEHRMTIMQDTASCLKRIEDIEGREEWTRNRFEEQQKRIEDIEGRESWTRNRFEEQQRRIEDIEGREEWTRERFDEHLDQLNRLNTAVDYSMEQGIMCYPLKEDEDNLITTVSLKGKNINWSVNKDAKDNISSIAKMGKLICGSAELLNLFKQSGTFIDIGANIGAFTLTFASQGWNGYAIEAAPMNVKALRKTINMNHFDVKVIDKAIYDHSGEIYFVQNGPWGFVKNEVFDEDYEKLDAICLDDYKETELRDVQKVDFIKMDIEGSEVSALRGMEQFTKKFGYPPILVEANAYALALQGETPSSLVMQGQKLGYMAYELRDGRLYPHSSRNFPMEYCSDYIFIKGNPAAFNVEVKEPIVQEEQEVVEYVIKTLEDRKEWNKAKHYGLAQSDREYGAYVCYCLKDFPQYYKNEKIANLLKQVKEELKNEFKDDAFVQNAISWF